MSLDKIKTEDLLKIAEYAADSYIPENVKITIRAGLGLPTAIRDGEEALLNLKILSIYGKELMRSGFAIGNAGLVIIGSHTVVKSSINYLEAQNKAAKICYGLSVLCSGTGAATSSVAIFCERCGLSNTGILGDSLGHVLLKAGDKVNQLGKRIEGKPKSFFNFRGGQIPRRRPAYTNSGSIAFVPTGCSSTISLQEIVLNLPYERIFFVGGTLLAIYSYGKLLVSVYSFLESKFYPKESYSQQVEYSAKFLIHSLDFNRIYRIYYVALAL